VSAQFGYNFAALLAAKKPNATLRQLSKPIRTVLAWQAAATLAMALAGAAFIGIHGAISAVAGGLVSIIAGLAAALVAARGGGILAGALRAEAVKVGLVVLLLWLVLANYAEAIVVVVIGAFVVTMLIFAMAFFVREY
jgi:ATP synthase protein I